MPFSTQRQLAAIMFTDMVGYTALMQRDESQAISNRTRCMAALEAAIQKHDGKVIQTYGDGTLSIFTSAIEAVNSAMEIQNTLQQEPKIPLRIGIHMGDIVFDEEGAYGDGVNLASRIESFAVSGSILISEKVFDEIKNQPAIKTTSLGRFRMKNVNHPMGVYAVSNPGLVIPKEEEMQGKGNRVSNSVAVLPFVNMSADPENEYFSDGITEEILNALTRVDGLQVTSRTSSFAFKGRNLDIRSIGKELNVGKVLEGSVRKAGNKVRVTAQLINVSDGYHVWSENYDRDLHDIFAVQDEISQKIAVKLRDGIKPIPRAALQHQAPVQNIEAYNLFLKGRYYWNKFSPEEVKKALELFNEAIEKDPEFALAYAYTAFCYGMLGAMGRLKPNIAYPKAQAAAEKALQLDDALVESHIAMGLIFVFYEDDMEKAEKHFERARALNPGSVWVQLTYAMHLTKVGKYDEAETYLEKAVEIDPLSVLMTSKLASNYYLNGKYEQALEMLDRSLVLDPEFRAAYEAKGWVYVMTGELEKSIEAFSTYQKMTGHPWKGLAGLGYAYAKAGMPEKTRELIALTEERDRTEPDVSLSVDFAILYLGLGEMDKAFDYIDQAYQEGLPSVRFIDQNPPFRYLQDHPRWKVYQQPIPS